MAEIELFDVQCGFGGAVPGAEKTVSAQDLAAEMSRAGIGRALARIVPEDLDVDFEISNRKLFTACSAAKQLVPCPAAVPSSAPDLPPETEQIDNFIINGAQAVWIRPANDCWSLEEWCSDRLFKALSERRMPVILPVRLVGLEKTAELARRYPELPLIVSEIEYRCLRILWPLLEKFRNVRVSTGNNFTIHSGIAAIVSKMGPERLLFGTGFPVSEPMSAIASLMYAEISDDAKRMIGHLNLERLLGEVS